MVLIPIGTSYTAQLEASSLKEVCCEQCRCEYVYVAARSGTGHGLAPLFMFQEAAESSAEKAAYQRLQKELAKAVDIAPCPRCSRVQGFMIRAKRVKIMQGAAVTAFVFLAPVLLFAAFGVGKSVLPDTLSRVAVGVLFEAGLVAAIGGALAFLFNPNAGRLFPFTRKAIQPTMTVEDFQAHQESEHQREQQELAERAEQIRHNQEKMEAENAAKRERAKARKEEEARKLAERAKRSI